MDIQKLTGVVPDEVFQELPTVMSKFSLNTTLRLSHFLSQCSHESNGFKFTSENLNYSADGLLKIFPKYFNAVTAPQYAHQPEKIANYVYANRLGNGPVESGDGFAFRGRGYIQLTGKNNYRDFGTSVNIDVTTTPDLVATKYPLLSAGWFFYKNGIYLIADQGNSVDVITAVTKRINGGTIGLDDRIAKFKQFYGLLS